jgi:hypothetical protein
VIKTLFKGVFEQRGKHGDQIERYINLSADFIFIMTGGFQERWVSQK